MEWLDNKLAQDEKRKRKKNMVMKGTKMDMMSRLLWTDCTCTEYCAAHIKYNFNWKFLFTENVVSIQYYFMLWNCTFRNSVIKERNTEDK